MCFKQQCVKFTEVWQIMRFFAGTPVWYHTHKNTETNTHRDTQHIQGPIDWHTQIDIYLNQLLWAQSSYLLLHWINNSLISKIYFPKCIFCSKVMNLQRSYPLISCYRTRFSNWNINSTNRSGVKNQTNIRTKHSGKGDTGKGSLV